jgi:hypothetical protein
MEYSIQSIFTLPSLPYLPYLPYLTYLTLGTLPILIQVSHQLSVSTPSSSSSSSRHLLSTSHLNPFFCCFFFFFRLSPVSIPSIHPSLTLCRSVQVPKSSLQAAHRQLSANWPSACLVWPCQQALLELVPTLSNYQPTYPSGQVPTPYFTNLLLRTYTCTTASWRSSPTSSSPLITRVQYTNLYPIPSPTTNRLKSPNRRRGLRLFPSPHPANITFQDCPHSAAYTIAN